MIFVRLHVADQRRRYPWSHAPRCGTRSCIWLPRRCAACRNRTATAFLQFFCDRSHGEAVAGADITDHDIDIVALIEVTQFLHLLGGAAILVDDDGLDLHAAEPDLFVRRWCRPLVQLVDDELRAVTGGDAETVRRGPGQEGHNAQFEGFLCGCGPCQGKRHRSGRYNCDSAVDPPKTVHDFLPLCFLRAPRPSAPFDPAPTVIDRCLSKLLRV